MNAITIDKTEKNMKGTGIFKTAKILSLLSLIGSIVMYVLSIFTSVTLPACLVFAFLTFLSIEKGKKDNVSEVFTSTLLVADMFYIVAIAFLFGRMFIR